MGSIYRPKYTDRHGQERESAFWWIQYYSHGRKIRESTETAEYADAKDILKRKEADATKGRITKSVERKVLFSELATLVEKDYELNGYHSLVTIELHNRLHILPFFGKTKAMQITEADIDDYILQRRSEEASNATITRDRVDASPGHVDDTEGEVAAVQDIDCAIRPSPYVVDPAEAQLAERHGIRSKPRGSVTEYLGGVPG